MQQDPPMSPSVRAGQGITWNGSLGHSLVLLLDNAGVGCGDPGQGQPGWTLPAPSFSLANCLTSGAAAVLGPGHSHNPVSWGFYSGFLLGILWVSVCVFQRHRHQVPCGQEPSAPLQQALQSIRETGKTVFFQVSKALWFAQHIFLIFHTGLSNNWNYCLVWDLRCFGNDHSGCSKVFNFMVR